MLTLILLTWTMWRAPTNARKWRMGFNSTFKGLNKIFIAWIECPQNAYEPTNSPSTLLIEFWCRNIRGRRLSGKQDNLPKRSCICEHRLNHYLKVLIETFHSLAYSSRISLLEEKERKSNHLFNISFVERSYKTQPLFNQSLLLKYSLFVLWMRCIK